MNVILVAFLLKEVYSTSIDLSMEGRYNMTNYMSMTKEHLQNELAAQMEHLISCKSQNLKLNMARGKPAKQQLFPWA